MKRTLAGPVYVTARYDGCACIELVRHKSIILHDMNIKYTKVALCHISLKTVKNIALFRELSGHFSYTSYTRGVQI